MRVVTRAQVLEEMTVIPGKLQHEFYIREEHGDDVIFRPIESSRIIK